MKEKRMNPYVGITGVRGRKDALDCLGSESAKALFEDHGFLTMIGVMVGPRTFDLPRPSTSSFPTIEQVKASFTNRRNALNTLHYWHKPTTGKVLFARTLGHLIEGSGEHLHAVQFDFSTPDVGVLLALRKGYPNLRIIIQLGGRRDQDLLENEKLLRDWLNEWGCLADDVLVDLSGGRGLLLDTAQVAECFDCIESHSPELMLATAGGLDANSVFDLEGILDERPGTSFDVQGRVRLPKDEGGGLHMGKVHAYQRSALEVIRETSQS